MSFWQAVFLGLVQGITEFLPISSSGHLSILNNLFGMSTPEDGHLFFDVLLHLGTLVSICVVYWKDIVAMFFDVLGFAGIGPAAGDRKSRYPAARMFLMIILATLPLALVLPIKDQLETLYYNSMTVWDSLIIGLCQCAAVIPGLSRSGTTITAGLATGLRRDYAVKFAFLMSIPAVLGANLLSLVDAAKDGIDWSMMPAYLAGMLAASAAGILSIRLLKLLANRGRFGGFAYYCWVMGVLAIILTMIF